MSLLRIHLPGRSKLVKIDGLPDCTRNSTRDWVLWFFSLLFDRILHFWVNVSQFDLIEWRFL